ncbi:MAG: TipAS antibiotic-recognition domain-containing protein [Clostridia bacterium]|nr:TipAS antibiotic-recognition domain-containing protein [Clostridia bacterium]
MNKPDYTAEVSARYGATDAYRESVKKTAGYTPENWSVLESGMNQCFADFAAAMQEGVPPESPAAQVLVKNLRDFITEKLYTCTLPILKGLGTMYVSDPRFRKNIDRHAPGNAAYVATAIEKYCEE